MNKIIHKNTFKGMLYKTCNIIRYLFFSDLSKKKSYFNQKFFLFYFSVIIVVKIVTCE